MEDKGYLQYQMENARQELHSLVQQFGFSHPRVLKQSKELDELINKYNRMLYKNKFASPATMV